MIALPANLIAIAVPAVVVVASALYLGVRVPRRRHARSLRRLYFEADGMEHDLKECRTRLEHAHAVMAAGAHPAPSGEADAHAAIAAALRELLAHRLWLRDQSAAASQAQLDAALAALVQARAVLGRQLSELDSAQRALNRAVRERLHGGARS